MQRPPAAPPPHVDGSRDEAELLRGPGTVKMTRLGRGDHGLTAAWTGSVTSWGPAGDEGWRPRILGERLGSPPCVRPLIRSILVERQVRPVVVVTGEVILQQTLRRQFLFEMRHFERSS